MALMYLAGKLSKFEVENWTGRTHKHLRWWDVFVEDVTMDLLEGESLIIWCGGGNNTIGHNPYSDIQTLHDIFENKLKKFKQKLKEKKK